MTQSDYMSPLFRLNPALPVTWESVDTLRVGFECVVTRIERPSRTTERFLQLLRSGLTFEQANSRHYGFTAQEWSHLMRVLGPALVPADSPDTHDSEIAGSRLSRIPPLALIGEKSFIQQIAPPLAHMGCRLLTSRNAERLAAQRTTVVSMHSYLEPDRFEYSDLSLTLPTLHIRFTDQSVWIGPYVLPGASPCSRCALLREIDADPQRSAVAAQLFRRVIATAHDDTMWRIASIILTMLMHLPTRVELASSRLRISNAAQGSALEAQLHQLQTHPRCSCHAVESDCVGVSGGSTVQLLQ